MIAIRRPVHLLLLAVTLWAFVLEPLAAVTVARPEPAHAQTGAVLGALALSDPVVIAAVGAVAVAGGLYCATSTDCRTAISALWTAVPSALATGILGAVGAGARTMNPTTMSGVTVSSLKQQLDAPFDTYFRAQALPYTVGPFGIGTSHGTTNTISLPVIQRFPKRTSAPTAGLPLVASTINFTVPNTANCGDGTCTNSNVTQVSFFTPLIKGTDVMNTKIHQTCSISASCPRDLQNGINGTGGTIPLLPSEGLPANYFASSQFVLTTPGIGGVVTLDFEAVDTILNGGNVGLGDIYVQYTLVGGFSATTLAVPHGSWSAPGSPPTIAGVTEGVGTYAGTIAIPATDAALAGVNANAGGTVVDRTGAAVPIAGAAPAPVTDTGAGNTAGLLGAMTGVLQDIRTYVTDIPNVLTKITALPGNIATAIHDIVVPSVSLSTAMATPMSTLEAAVPACFVTSSLSAAGGLLAGAGAAPVSIHLATIGGTSIDLPLGDSTPAALSRLMTKVVLAMLGLLYAYGVFLRVFKGGRE